MWAHEVEAVARAVAGGADRRCSAETEIDADGNETLLLVVEGETGGAARLSAEIRHQVAAVLGVTRFTIMVVEP